MPASAPQIERVECVRIASIDNWHQWAGIPGVTIGAWDGTDAAAIAGLVADLPGGQLMRCFTPRYGIRAHDADAILFEIAFCFRCHGALVLQPGRDEPGKLVGFAPDSPPARDLLARFRSTDQPETTPNSS